MSRRQSRGLRELWLAICVATAACHGAVPPSARPADGSLPSAAFFRFPTMTHVALSADGERIAGVVRQAGDQVVFVKPVRERGVRALGKLDDPRETVRTLGWAGDSSIVVGFDEAPDRVPRGGSRVLRMVRVPLTRWRPRELGPGWPLPTRPEGSDPVLHWLPEDPDHILVDRWESDQTGASARIARVSDGVQSVVVPSRPGVQRWFADSNGAVRAGRGYDPEAATEVDYARRSADGDFEPLADVDRVLALDLAFAGFAADPDIVYVYARTENGRIGLFEYDLERRRRTRLVHADPEVDVGALVYSPVDGRLWAVEVESDQPRLHFVDAEGEREHASIDAAFPGTTNRIVSASRDGSTAIVRVSGDTRPPAYYMYDRQRKEMALLFDSLPELEGRALARMRPVSFTARDGLEIPAYLTLPSGAEHGNLPVIVIVHDGPTERVHWGFDATAQYLASRGFAVFQPNFRGSSGYGLEFERKGYREWGGAMQDDVIDGVRWLIAEGIVDPDRIGVFGRGYGGYAALLAVAEQPDLFRAGAAWGAVTDRVALLERPEEYDAPGPNHPTAGATPRDREELAARSPAHLADRIRVPVFLAHGGRDRVVDIAQMRAMEQALEAAGREFESHVYHDQAHELGDEAERIEFHERLARFFADHLRTRVPL